MPKIKKKNWKKPKLIILTSSEDETILIACKNSLTYNITGFFGPNQSLTQCSLTQTSGYYNGCPKGCIYPPQPDGCYKGDTCQGHAPYWYCCVVCNQRVNS